MTERQFEQIVAKMARATGSRRFGTTVVTLWESRADTGWCELCNDARAALSALSPEDLRLLAEKALVDG